MWQISYPPVNGASRVIISCRKVKNKLFEKKAYKNSSGTLSSKRQKAKILGQNVALLALGPSPNPPLYGQNFFLGHGFLP